MKLNTPTTHEIQEMDFDNLLSYVGELESALMRMLDIATAEGFLGFYDSDLLLHANGLFTTEVAR